MNELSVNPENEATVRASKQLSHVCSRKAISGFLRACTIIEFWCFSADSKMTYRLIEIFSFSFQVI